MRLEEANPIIQPPFRAGLYRIRNTADGICVDRSEHDGSRIVWEVAYPESDPLASVAVDGYRAAEKGMLGSQHSGLCQFTSGQCGHFTANLAAETYRALIAQGESPATAKLEAPHRALDVILDVVFHPDLKEGVAQLGEMGLMPINQLGSLEQDAELQQLITISARHAKLLPECLGQAKHGNCDYDDLIESMCQWLAIENNPVLQHLPSVSADLGRALLARLAEHQDGDAGIELAFAHYPKGSSLLAVMAGIIGKRYSLLDDLKLPGDMVDAINAELLKLPLASNSDEIAPGVAVVNSDPRQHLAASDLMHWHIATPAEREAFDAQWVEEARQWDQRSPDYSKPIQWLRDEGYEPAEIQTPEQLRRIVRELEEEGRRRLELAQDVMAAMDSAESAAAHHRAKPKGPGM